MASHRQRPPSDDHYSLRNYPRVRFAKSRKIQKGEDFEFCAPNARWVSKSILNRRRHRMNQNDAKEDETRMEDLSSCEFFFLSVFDGHGGKECADFCAKETLSSLLKALNSLEAELKKEEKQKVVEQNEVSRLYKISPFLSLSPVTLSFHPRIFVTDLFTLSLSLSVCVCVFDNRIRKTCSSIFSRRR